MTEAVLRRLLPLRLRLLWNGFQVRRRVPRFVHEADAGPPRPNRLAARVLAGLRFVTRMHRENLRLLRVVRRRLTSFDRGQPVVVVGHGDALAVVRSEARRRGLRVESTFDWSTLDDAGRSTPEERPLLLAVLADHESWIRRLEAAGVARERVVVACPLADVDG